MPSVAQLLERESETVDLERDHFERLTRRRDRKQLKRRIGAAVLAIVLALLSFATLTRAFRGAERPADEPAPKPPGIFSEVGGWIAYGNQQGIWAVDPSHPNARESQIQLSTNEGIPLAWSSDGSELLISRGSELLSRRQLLHGEEVPASRRGLFVLHADGTETRLVRDMVSGASFSPDGTTVVFAPELYTPAHLDRGIYRIEADGGVPRLLLAPSRRYYPDDDRSFRTELSLPTFSPDGTQIAYIDGMGDWGYSLRVMNADGSDVHALDGSDVHLLHTLRSEGSLGGWTKGLSWSPDGTRLAVGLRYAAEGDVVPKGIYVVDADGSGLTLTIPGGVNPYWSPDGLRISFKYDDAGRSPLLIADRDGTHVQNGGWYATTGPWNPLVQPEPEVAEVSAAGEDLTPASMLLALATLMILVVGALVVRRRMVHRSQS